MKTHFSTIIFIIIFVLSSFHSFSQKVGLVLSGGGAKGLAHIGVIRALEQNNIPIDYITGTSIGAIIGGLYSVGYTPDEMEKLFASKEFEIWSKGLIEENYMYFFKKAEDNASWISLKISNDSTTRAYLPTNYVPNHQMDFAFMQLWAGGSAAANYNFDSLMIPFRCVAADVYKKEQIIFRNGDLSTAIRTSMTLPFIYKPVEVDNRLLFDGGIYNNFPVDIMEKDFHPDIIIGSAVTSNTGKPEQNDLLSQVLNLIIDKSNFNVPKEKGILIRPNVEMIGLLDFEKLDILSNIGYQATIDKIDTIMDLIKRRQYLVEINKKRDAFIVKIPKPLFDSIEIEGLKPYQSEYARKTITKKQKEIDVLDLKAEFFKLIADGHIDYLYPMAIYNKNTGRYILRLKSKLAKSLNAKIGGNISSTSINQGFAQLEYKYLRKFAFKFDANIYFGKFYNSFRAKSRVDFAGNVPFFIDANLSYHRWDYLRSNPNVFFDDDRPSYLIQNETSFHFNSGFPIKRNGMMVFGGGIGNLMSKYYQTVYFKSTDTTDATSFNLVTAHLTYHENTLNRKQYADKGTEFKFQIRYIAGIEKHYPGSTSVTRQESRQDHGYFQIRSYYDNYSYPFKKLTIGIYLEACYSLQDYFSNYTSTILYSNAFQPIPFSKTLFIENFRSFNYVGGGIKNVYKFSKDLQLRLEMYLFQPYKQILKQVSPSGEYYATSGNSFEKRYLIGYGAFVYHSPIGPASISVHYFQNERTQWYFVFNIGYILFNKRLID